MNSNSNKPTSKRGGPGRGQGRKPLGDKGPSPVLQVVLPPELLKQVREKAEAENMSASKLAGKLIEQGMEKMKPTQLTASEMAEMERTLTYPHASFANASFYASMTGQTDVFTEMWKSTDRLVALVESLKADGLVAEEALGGLGHGGEPMQLLAEKRQKEDGRFAEYLALTKVRFLVTVADDETNKAMIDSVRVAGYPGEAGIEWMHRHLLEATQTNSVN